MPELNEKIESLIEQKTRLAAELEKKYKASESALKSLENLLVRQPYFEAIEIHIQVVISYYLQGSPSGLAYYSKSDLQACEADIQFLETGRDFYELYLDVLGAIDCLTSPSYKLLKNTLCSLKEDCESFFHGKDNASVLNSALPTYEKYIDSSFKNDEKDDRLIQYVNSYKKHASALQTFFHTHQDRLDTKNKDYVEEDYELEKDTEEDSVEVDDMEPIELSWFAKLWRALCNVLSGLFKTSDNNQVSFSPVACHDQNSGVKTGDAFIHRSKVSTLASLDSTQRLQSIPELKKRYKLDGEVDQGYESENKFKQIKPVAGGSTYRNITASISEASVHTASMSEQIVIDGFKQINFIDMSLEENSNIESDNNYSPNLKTDIINGKDVYSGNLNYNDDDNNCSFLETNNVNTAGNLLNEDNTINADTDNDVSLYWGKTTIIV